MIYICRYVCRVPKCIGDITWPKHVHDQSQFWAVKTDLRHLCYSFRLYARTVLALAEKKRSLKNGKHKANRASETEERRKERLKIGRKKDKARRRTKKLQEEK